MNEPPSDLAEELLARCLEAPATERRGRLAALCAEHPDQADLLRERAEALDRMGLRVFDAGADGDEPACPLDPDSGELPERLGDFRLLRPLGGGGMGVVCEAEQESLGRVVALKLIRPEHLFFPRARERFRLETEAIARLQHPAIVPIYAVGEDRGVPYFAMERVHGCTLAEALRALAGRAPEALTGRDLAAVVAAAAGEELPAAGPGFRGSWVDACLGVVRQIAEALAHAHGRGILHRDVKPSNVVLSPDGRARLIDFGLTQSSASQRVTRTGAQMGTLLYMSPEQLRGAREVDARSDVYSLGVTLHELLTLRPAFHADESSTTQARILGGQAEPVRARNPRVPSDVETVCQTARDVDPARRYATARAFADDLENLLERRPIRARAPGPLLRARRWAQRHPASATAVLLGSLVAVGIPSALYLQARAHAADLKVAYGEVQEALGKEREARAAAVAAQAEAEDERARTATAADMAMRSLEFFYETVLSASPHERPGPVATVPDLLEIGADRVEARLAGHPRARGRVQMMLGQLFAEYGDHPRAVELLDGALATFDAAADPGIAGWASSARLALSDSLRATGDWERCGRILREETEALRAAGNAEGQRLALNRLTVFLSERGDFEGSDAAYEELLALLAAEPGREDSLAIGLVNHGQSLLDRGHVDAAVERMQAGLERLEELYDPPHPRLAQGSVSLAAALMQAGEVDRAGELLRDALAMSGEVWGDGSDMVAICRMQLACLERDHGDLAAAERLARDGAAGYRGAYGDESPGTAHASSVLGGILVRREAWDEAADVLDAALASPRAVAAMGTRFEGLTLADRARAREALGRSAEAVDDWRAAWELLRELPDERAEQRTCLERLAALEGDGSPWRARLEQLDAESD